MTEDLPWIGSEHEPLEDSIGLSPSRQSEPLMRSLSIRCAAIGMALLVPLSVWSIIAARPSRVLSIHVHGFGEKIVMADLNAAAIRARMQCRYQPDNSDQPYDMDRGFGWISSQPTHNLFCSGDGIAGSVRAVGIKDKNLVVLDVLSGNVSTPNGEVDPAIEQVLQDLRKAIMGDADIESPHECRAPIEKPCT